MANAKKISIVLPTYRRVAFLKLILAELDKQLDRALRADVEIVIVDNDPDGSAETVTLPNSAFRYVHEKQPGVVHARNKGVTSALGEFVVFLDDDEIPSPGWLAAFYQAAGKQWDVCFGPISPEFTSQPPKELRDPLTKIFSRQLNQTTGKDISDLRAHLGTGNSMFRATCFDDPAFNVAFNAGGEDIWLIRQLVEDKAMTLRWVQEAHVFEQVPEDRCTKEFIYKRRFTGGMLRCVIDSGTNGPMKWPRIAKWMTVGAGQVLIFGVLGTFSQLLKSSKAPNYFAKYYAGLGKLLWWRHPYFRKET